MMELVGFHAYVEFKRFGRHRPCCKMLFRGTGVLQLLSDYGFSASLISLYSLHYTASGHILPPWIHRQVSASTA